MSQQHPEREAVTQLLDTRRRSSDRAATVGTERVDVELDGSGNGPFRVRKKDWEWIVDEPPARGGTDSAPNPLAYFLSGSVTCLLSHYMLFAISEGVQIDELKTTARMRYDRRTEVSKIVEVIYDIRVSSPAERDTIESLVRRAQDVCYAHNTLAAADAVLTTNVALNGAPLISLAL